MEEKDHRRHVPHTLAIQISQQCNESVLQQKFYVSIIDSTEVLITNEKFVILIVHIFTFYLRNKIYFLLNWDIKIKLVTR